MRAKVAISLFSLGLAGASNANAQVSVPEQTVMIFFDWGKSAIDRDSAAALDQEAAAFLQSPGSAVTVDGFSDRSGNAAANSRSSRVRAEMVRDYLVAHGVPAERIAVHAWGEGRPMIATADGVREPQNRRVDVRVVSKRGN
jgi:outer membrane protein OmpA-like peptidoglycan-associated protein